MKKKNVGFALLLIGNIFAAPADTILWYIGVTIGLVGLILVCFSKEEN
ncbi:MAG: hypothetical protein K2N63_03835 [Lachnospiraceae bacterium]|nr:hypothetical protein [Lachnospiraceae bacterium]